MWQKLMDLFELVALSLGLQLQAIYVCGANNSSMIILTLRNSEGSYNYALLQGYTVTDTEDGKIFKVGNCLTQGLVWLHQEQGPLEALCLPITPN